MDADHADHATRIVANRSRYIDETERLVVGRRAEEFGQELRLVHVTDGRPLQPVLKPGAGLHGLAFQHALRCGLDRSVGRGISDPGIIRVRGLDPLERLADARRISGPDGLQSRHGGKIAGLPVPLEHAAIQNVRDDASLLRLMGHDDAANAALGDIGRANGNDAHEREAQDADQQGHLLPERSMAHGQHRGCPPKINHEASSLTLSCLVLNDTFQQIG